MDMLAPYIATATTKYELYSQHLMTAKTIVEKVFETKTLPALSSIPTDVIITTGVAILIVHIILALFTKSGREFIFGSIATVFVTALAFFLLFVLIAIPFAVVWGAYKILALAIAFLLTIPAVKEQYDLYLAKHVALAMSKYDEVIALFMTTVKDFLALAMSKLSELIALAKSKLFA
eukprot:CAMPEP_0170143298 /NCGR_PEP_ID=MMETSP0033_2-20121228/10052_1 /TAXON_ID=195969 /ORGANISM="Dolichomastix tenuilepis, Strain CCMP3274" /LENGTH=176 /DNA_ID=CAMNT_0010379735 /DNA_START=55 /DNA_END=585 /DNA_ORIENTATION=+